MSPPSGSHLIWAIAAASTAGVVFRPWKMPEAVWAVSGALLLPLLGLLPWRDVAGAVAKGTDVYLFLVGMMLLAELARREGLFDYAAGVAVMHARGSAHRLFALVYAIGVLVTVLLSNDATAVVLTPAVYAVCKKAEAKEQYLKAWRAMDEQGEYRRLVEVKLTALGVDPKPTAATPAGE